MRNYFLDRKRYLFSIYCWSFSSENNVVRLIDFNDGQLIVEFDSYYFYDKHGTGYFLFEILKYLDTGLDTLVIIQNMDGIVAKPSIVALSGDLTNKILNIRFKFF